MPLLDWGTIAQVAQLKPSESREESYWQAEGPGVGPSRPSVGMTAAAPQETPAEEPPMQEAPVADPSRPDTPAPMETGGAGDGQTWAEQVERVWRLNSNGPGP